MGARYPIVVLVLVGLACLLAGAQQAPGSSNGSNKPKQEPQIYFDVGPLKMAVTYKENKFNDKLKLSKSVVNYFLTDEQNPFYKHLMKATHREDLVRCENFLKEQPEMESLIDCKPLESHVLDAKMPADQPVASKYVKRTLLSHKTKLDFFSSMLNLEFAPRQDYQLYPFEEDFTHQSIKRILHENNMTQGLGFGPLSVTSGHFVVANMSDRFHCTASLFISVNLTKPIAEREPGDNYPEYFHNRSLTGLKFFENGGFVSLQDASCGVPTLPGPKLNMDFTLIYRQQFPYLTCSHSIRTKPIDKLWTYDGSITQSRDPSSSSGEAYNTSVQIQSSSAIVTGFNFNLAQNFTNTDFTTGNESMLLIHPILSAVVRGEWSPDTLLKSVALFFRQSFEPTLLNGGGAALFNDPKVMLIYSNKPQEKYVTMTMTIDRTLFDNYKNAFDQMVDDSFVERDTLTTPSPEEDYELVFEHEEL